MTATPAVSVVVPTYNRLDRLRRVLAAFSAQTYDRSDFEVIVVSDGSTDGTDDYLEGVSTGFELVFAGQANAGPAAARNRGVQLARAPLILFIDDDVIASPQLIEKHVLAHESAPGDAVVIGPMLDPPQTKLNAWVQWEQAMLYKQYDAMSRGEYEPTYRQFYTGNASVMRASVLARGGFDTRFRRAEDVELAYRLGEAGARFVFDREAIGYHYAERSFQSWLRNAHDYGVNDVVFAREQGRPDRLNLVREEFFGRHPLVRWLTRACLGRPWLEHFTEWQLGLIGATSHALRIQTVTRFSLSGLYNMSYYLGMAQEMGGARAFLELVQGSPNASS